MLFENDSIYPDKLKESSDIYQCFNLIFKSLYEAIWRKLRKGFMYLIFEIKIL